MTKYTWEHIHLKSPDPAGTAQWYEDKLGAEIIRTPLPDGSTRYDLDLTVRGSSSPGRPRRRPAHRLRRLIWGWSTSD